MAFKDCAKMTKVCRNLDKENVTAVSLRLRRFDDADGECFFSVVANYNGYEWVVNERRGYPLRGGNAENMAENLAVGGDFYECMTDRGKTRPPYAKRVAVCEAVREHLKAKQGIIAEAMRAMAREAMTSDDALREQVEALTAERDALKEAAKMPDVNTLIMQNVVDALTPAIVERVRERVGALADAVPTRLEVKLKDGVHTTGEAVRHEKFEQVVQIVAAGFPVWLLGEAGTGKSVLCEQVAEAIGAEYYYSGAILDEFAGLKGFIDANGAKHGTQFTAALEAAKEGKEVLFCMDEADGSTPEVLLVLNNLLSGGAVECMGECYRMTDNLHIIACGNTNGRGGSTAYTRSIIDSATLDRFMMVEIDYSRGIELATARGDEALAAFARALRDSARSCGIDLLVTYRSIARLRKLQDVMPLRAALDGAVLRGLDPADVKTLYEDMRGALSGNAWLAALA